MPGDGEALTAICALADIDLPEACEAGVATNLALLAEHWRNVEAFDIPESPDR